MSAIKSISWFMGFGVGFLNKILYWKEKRRKGFILRRCDEESVERIIVVTTWRDEDYRSWSVGYNKDVVNMVIEEIWSLTKASNVTIMLITKSSVGFFYYYRFFCTYRWAEIVKRDKDEESSSNMKCHGGLVGENSCLQTKTKECFCLVPRLVRFLHYDNSAVGERH